MIYCNYLKKGGAELEYIWALDISMANTGVAIFDNDGNVVKVFSLPTRAKDNHGVKLKSIADRLLDWFKEYPCELLVMERGFSRFNTSTQVVFRVHGLVNYLFWDKEQIYYPPKMIKLALGSGTLTKKEMCAIIKERYPLVEMLNDDESDAVAIGLCYFKKKKGSAK